MPIISLARPVSLPPVGDAAAATDGAVPALRALGGPYATAEEEDGRVLCRGGETAALERMRAHLQRTQWVAAFEKPQTSPTELNPFGDGTRSTTARSLAATLTLTQNSKPNANPHPHLNPTLT